MKERFEDNGVVKLQGKKTIGTLYIHFSMEAQ